MALGTQCKTESVWFEGKIAMDKDPEVFIMDAAATMELMVNGKIFLKPLQHAEMEENFMIMNSFIGMNKKEHEEHIQSIIYQRIREKCWTGSLPSFMFASKPLYNGIPYSEKKDWGTRKKLTNSAIYVVMRTGFSDYTIHLVKAAMRSKRLSILLHPDEHHAKVWSKSIPDQAFISGKGSNLSLDHKSKHWVCQMHSHY